MVPLVQPGVFLTDASGSFAPILGVKPPAHGVELSVALPPAGGKRAVAGGFSLRSAALPTATERKRHGMHNSLSWRWLQPGAVSG